MIVRTLAVHFHNSFNSINIKYKTILIHLKQSILEDVSLHMCLSYMSTFAFLCVHLFNSCAHISNIVHPPSRYVRQGATNGSHSTVSTYYYALNNIPNRSDGLCESISWPWWDHRHRKHFKRIISSHSRVYRLLTPASRWIFVSLLVHEYTHTHILKYNSIRIITHNQRQI